MEFEPTNEVTWRQGDLPLLPPGDITWDETAGEWLVGGRPTPPGRYLRDGEVTQLLDPANPDDCIL